MLHDGSWQHICTDRYTNTSPQFAWVRSGVFSLGVGERGGGGGVGVGELGEEGREGEQG